MSTLTPPRPTSRSGEPDRSLLDEVCDQCAAWAGAGVVSGDLLALEGLGAAPVMVRGAAPPVRTGPVVVALDDDGNAGALLRHGRIMAERLGVRLRAAYVWSDCRPPDCPHHRSCHRDLAAADRLLTLLIDEHLPVDEADRIERDVLHHRDPAEALVELSAAASVLVVGSPSDQPAPGDVLGTTTRSLLGRTRCPVVVVPYHRSSVTDPDW